MSSTVESSTTFVHVWDTEFPAGPVDTKMHGPYQRGDRLLYEKPWIFVVSEKLREQICNHCFQREKGLKRCTGCAFSWYCGKSCQKTSWKSVHKHECPVFKKALQDEELTIPLGIETVRLCLQALIRVKNDPNWRDPSEGFPILPHRTFPNLMSHWEEIKVDKKEVDFIDLMSNYFHKVLKGLGDYEDLLELESLGTIYGKIRINNMTIFGTYGDKLGVGLYLSGSAIDHACLPNACPSFSGTLINIHATESVDCFDNVRLSYLDQIYFSVPRREMLKKRYYFDCFCRACSDENMDQRMNGIRCPGKTCSNAILMNPYSFESDPCSGCGCVANKVLKDQVTDLLKRGREIQAMMSEAKKTDNHPRVLDLAETLHRDLSKVFHDTNSLVISTALQVASSADVLGQFDKAFTYFSSLRLTYPKVFPFWSFQNAEILMKCTTRGLLVKTNQKDQRALLIHFVEAMKIVTVCAGRDSPTFAYYKKFYDDCRES
ncbi:putative N-lysine methyltransferase SMYD2 [Hypsibius exemplaris]|uniref:N-lysine methyltransferase SMYD2 n=1 Tax=Hypsibius exemplaris TaxID=2072580 RepID=A0A1W0W980_HYPEX|nr:putative N-lysine methyltransferase SMYD2 [Hypsibius exemplaris]